MQTTWNLLCWNVKIRICVGIYVNRICMLDGNEECVGCLISKRIE